MNPPCGARVRSSRCARSDEGLRKITREVKGIVTGRDSDFILTDNWTCSDPGAFKPPKNLPALRLQLRRQRFAQGDGFRKRTGRFPAPRRPEKGDRAQAQPVSLHLRVSGHRTLTPSAHGA